MLYAKLSDLEANNKITISEKELRARLEGFSVPSGLTNTVLNPLGYVALEAPDSTGFQETSSKKLSSDIIKNPDGTYQRIIVETECDEVETERRYAKKLNKVRAKRNELLKLTDFTQLVDFDSSKYPGIQEYRQTLRDITNDMLDPYLVVFPEYKL